MNITKNSTLIFYILFILMIFSPIFGVAVVNSIALLIAITSIILCFFDQKILELYKNRYSFCFGLFFLFLILSSLNSDYYILSLKETIPFLFYLPFSIFFIYLISFNINLFLRFLYISLIIIFFILFIFLIYELIITSESITKYNYSSLFENKVLGNFTIKFFPIIFGLTFYYFQITKNKKFILIFFIIFLISLLMIIASGQRTSFFKFIICALLLIIFLIKNKKKLILVLPILSIVIVFINYLSNNSLYERFYSQTLKQIQNENQIVIFSKQHNAHFQTSLNMFRDNPFFGIGPNIFKYECGNQKYIFYYDRKYENENYTIQYGCSTHPHNYYLELLSETGIFNFILFISFYLFLLYELVIIPINSKYSFIHKSSIISLLIIYFPLSPSLSFFNSWSNSLNFIVFSIFIFFTMRYHKN